MVASKSEPKLKDNTTKPDDQDTKRNQPKKEVSVKPHVSVQAKPDESAESLLRRFNREVMRAGIMRRLKELEYYEKPSRKRRREEALKKYKASFLEEIPYVEEE